PVDPNEAVTLCPVSFSKLAAIAFISAVKFAATATFTSSAKAADDKPKATSPTNKERENIFMNKILRSEKSGGHGKNDVRCLDHGRRLTSNLQTQCFDAVIRNNRSNGFSTRQFDDNLSIHHAFLPALDRAAQCIARTALEIRINTQ